MPRGRKRYAKELDVDPSPLYAVKVNEDGTVDNSVAYDPAYTGYCESCESRYPLKEGHDCEEKGTKP